MSSEKVESHTSSESSDDISLSQEEYGLAQQFVDENAYVQFLLAKAKIESIARLRDKDVLRLTNAKRYDESTELHLPFLEINYALATPVQRRYFRYSLFFIEEVWLRLLLGTQSNSSLQKIKRDIGRYQNAKPFLVVIKDILDERMSADNQLDVSVSIQYARAVLKGIIYEDYHYALEMYDELESFLSDPERLQNTSAAEMSETGFCLGLFFGVNFIPRLRSLRRATSQHYENLINGFVKAFDFDGLKSVCSNDVESVFQMKAFESLHRYSSDLSSSSEDAFLKKRLCRFFGKNVRRYRYDKFSDVDHYRMHGATSYETAEVYRTLPMKFNV